MFNTPQQFMTTMAIVLFFSGIVTMVVGILVLTSQAIGKNLTTLTAQVSKLGQKGISEDLSGLVGNASNLLTALNSLVKSTAGIGIFLVFVSFVLFLATYGVLFTAK